jgi:flagellar basal body-associated protein FliL
MAQEEEKEKTDTAPDTPEAPQPPVGKAKIGKKIAILGIVLAVVAIECGAAYWLLSSAGSAAAQASEPAEAKAEGKAEEKSEHKTDKHEGKERIAKDPNEQIEVVLGDFSVTTFQPATNATLRIEFKLYGTVGAKHEKEFLAALEENQHRFRDQVLVIVRSAEITDLTDAGLGLVKRKIMEKTNRMVGKPLLQSIIFSDFSFIEQ